MRGGVLLVGESEQADLKLMADFLARVDREPDRGIWGAYSFRAAGTRGPVRVYRLVVHLPGTAAERHTMLFTRSRWAVWRALTVVCRLSPGLERLWTWRGSVGGQV